MMKYKKMIVILVFLLAFMAFNGLVYAQTITEGSENIEVNLYGEDISVFGKINEINKDITIVVYRNSDSAIAYIDQSKTNENGEYSFQFALPNGTYKSEVSCGSKKYTTSNIVVYKEPTSGEEEEINVVVNGIKVNINGKTNEKNKDISIKVYRNSDNAIAYIDQGKTNENGEYCFQFSLPNGTYKAEVTCGSKKYTTSNIVVYEEPTSGEEEEINVAVNGYKVNVNGKINEKNKDISIKVCRNSDNAISYIDQGKTNENGEFSFQFSLPNGIYKAFINCDSLKYTSSDIVINKKSDGGGGSSKKRPDVAIPDNSLVFNDITGHWAEDNIKKLIASGSINGYPDGTFKPDNNITRAEFITVLVKAFNMNSTSEGNFEDTRNHWAKDFINSALDNKVIQGYSDSLFGPDELITREQMAVMVAKALKLEVKEYEISFDDKDQISDWAKKYVASSVNQKLIVGYPDNTFRPKSSATRAEAVTVILNALNSISN